LCSTPPYSSALTNKISYVNGFISALKSYLEKYGDDGKAHFNAAVSKAQLSVNVSFLKSQLETVS
jgi:hypothetical protein